MKEVTVVVGGWEDWTDSVLSRKDTCVRMINCKPYGRTGMLQYVELSTKGRIKEVISQIRGNPNVLECEFMKSEKSRATGLVVTKNSPICRAITKYKGFCTTCILGRDKPYNRWSIVLSSDDSLDQMLTGLEKRGVLIRNVERETLPTNRILTLEQHSIIEIAEQRGFFEFPRKISLTKLAESLHMSKSNLEEILRRAEQKIAASYLSGFSEL